MDGMIPGGGNESRQTPEGPIGKFQCDHRKKKERVKATRICREVGLSTVCIGYNGGAGTPVVSPMVPGGQLCVVCGKEEAKEIEASRFQGRINSISKESRLMEGGCT